MRPMRILSCAAAALTTNTNAAVAAILHTKARMTEPSQNTELFRAYWSNKGWRSQSPLQDRRIASTSGNPHYTHGCWRRAGIMKAIIVGGGIGGLTTALMLHARGIDCEIFEQADSVRELGVGINTLPHAIKELAQLGLLPRLEQVGIRTHELFYMNRIGQEIWREP